MADMYSTGAAPRPDHESNSKMLEPAAAKPKSGRRMTVESVTIRPAANGGYIAECHKKAQSSGGGEMPMPSYESKEYAFSNLDEVSAFLGREFGAPTESAAAVPDSAMAEEDALA